MLLHECGEQVLRKACRPPRELVSAPDRFLVRHECDYVDLQAPHLSSLCWVADFLMENFR
jgi:hypothetical protein